MLERANRFDLIEAPEIGYIRPLCKAVKSKIEALSATTANKPKSENCTLIRWLALKWSYVDESGEPLLTADDRKTFDDWDDSFIEPIFDAILEHSNVTDKDKEAFEKN